MSVFDDDPGALQDLREWLPKHMDKLQMYVQRDLLTGAAAVSFIVPEAPVRERSTGGEPDLGGFLAYREYENLMRELRRQEWHR